MATYNLFGATPGPAAPVAYTGNFLAGVCFKVTQGGMFLSAYRMWCPGTNGDTVARKFALWNVTGANTGQLITAGTVTSGTLVAGQWNTVTLATPVPLAIGQTYVAATGWAATNGFPDSDTTGAGTGAGDSFGTGGHTSGITSGPLFGFSDQAGGGGLAPDPFGCNQGLFSVAGTDPTLIMPNTGSNSGNFWVDVVVSDTTPAGYSGTYRLWPNTFAVTHGSVPDLNVNYSVATEIHLTQTCTVSKIWYYSPAGTAQLATEAGIYLIQGANAGAKVVANTSPSWSGAAGSGWISTTVTGVLAAGSYKVYVYNSAGVPDEWSVKDAANDLWRNGAYSAGITWGPVFAPPLAQASLCYNFNGNAGGTPPYSDGTTLAGQSSFAQNPVAPNFYPYLVALVATPTAGSTQNYFVDAEFTPAAPASQTTTGAPDRSHRLWRKLWLWEDQ